MNEKAFTGEKQTINDRLTIEKELIDNFNKYISANEVLLQNYTSFGDFSLMQNETEIMYQIPLDLKCIENELYNNKVNAGNKDFLKRKINFIKLLDYGRNLNYWVNTTNVRNYFFYNNTYNILVNPLLTNDFYRDDLTNIHENLKNAYNDLRTYGQEYNNIQGNNEQDIDNKINILRNITDKIIYLQDFDMGNINPDTPLSNTITESQSNSNVDTRTKDNNKKLYQLYKEFYILYQYYELCKDFIKSISNSEIINNEQNNVRENRNNFIDKLIAKILEINNHFNKRYKDIYKKIPPLPEPKSTSTQETTPRTEPERREMNVMESIQHYKDMIFEIFDKK